MSKISTYEVTPVPKLADKLIGTSVGGEIEDITYNFTLSELLNLFIPNIPANTLQGVLDYGNTATQDIILNGTIFTTYLEVTDTATILDSYLTGETHITGGLYDRLNSAGTAGQVLRSTGTQVEWYSIPNIIPTLQQVLAAGNTADINIILSSNIQALTATANNVVSNTSLSVNGTLKDVNASSGTSGQILSSTGTGVDWIDLPVYTATSPLSINSGTKNISIQKADSTHDGYLSSADWITFDGKQNVISLTTTGSSGPATLVGTTLNIPNYGGALSGYVPTSRTLTINGVTYDLSANRTWTIASGVASVTATAPLSSTGGANPDISITKSDNLTDGYLSSTDWVIFNNKQNYLSGSGLVKSTSGTITYITDNSSNWNTAYNDSIVSAAVTGTSTKTITLNQQDGGTVTANWTDLGLTSVGVSMPSAFSVSNSPLTSNGTIAISGAGTTLQYIDGTGALQSFPSLSGFVTSVTATSPLASSGGTTPNVTIQQSSGSQNGYLSSTDWTTFNNKQAAGNYITSLTGEATGTGPGAASVTLSNPAVTGKVLTGVNITGGSISATDSILTAFGKVQNQINGLIGSTIYQGTWNASTNTPALASGVGTRGYYYIVSVAGTTNLDGITDWFVGDWAIFDGTAWQQVDNTDAVVSVNGQTGAVSLTTDNIPEGTTNLYYLNSRARTALSFTAGSGAYNSSTGVITIPTNTSQLTNGANFITLSSLSATSPLSYNNTTGAFSISQSTTSTNGYLSATDWTTFNSKQTALNGTGFVKISGTTISYDNSTYLTTSAASSTYTPYTGATTNVNLGYNNLTAQNINIDGNATYGGGLNLKQATGFALGVPSGYTSIYADTSNHIGFTINNGPSDSKLFTLIYPYPNLTSYQYTLPNGSGTLALVGGSGVGTVTSVAALTIGTSGTDLSSTVANSTTTPVITLNVPTASATNRGALSSADWTTFNSKQVALSGTGFVKISGTTISYDNSTYYLASNPNAYIALTALSSTATGLTYTNTTGVFSLTAGYSIPTTASQTNWDTAYTNRITSATSPLSITSNVISISQATTSTNGYLSSTDWNTFNNKQSTITNPVTGTSTSGYVTYWNGTSSVAGSVNHFWDNTNNRLGIGTNNPQRSLTIYNATADNHLQIAGSAPSVSLTDTVTGATYQAKFGLATASGQYATGAVAGDFVIISQTGSTIWANSGGERMRLNTSGYVGIGTSSPKTLLDVYYNGDIWHTFIGGGTSKLLIGGQAGSGGVVLQAGNASTANNAAPTTAYNMYLQRDGGNVGIGTSSPSNKLQVKGVLAIERSITGDVSTFSNEGGNFYISAASSYNTIFQNGSTEYMRITSGGKLLINTTTDYSTGNLQVNSGISITGTITNLATGTGTYTRSVWYNDTSNQVLFENPRITDDSAGTGRTVYFTWRGGPTYGGGVQLIHGTNTWAPYTSDARLKTIVANVENGLDAIMKLKPVKYKWTKELETSKTISGFTAQNVGEAIPEAMFKSWKNEEFGDILSYYQDYLTPYLVKAIQEIVDKYDNKISILEAQIEKLKSKNNG